MPTVRSVDVRFNATGVAKYIADVSAMGAATDKAFRGASRSTSGLGRDMSGTNREAVQLNTALGRTAKQLNRIQGEAGGAGGSLQGMGRDYGTAINSNRQFQSDLGSTRRELKSTESALNSTKGRVGLLGEALITLGPALSPLTGVAVAGVAGMATQLGGAALAGGAAALALQGVGEAVKAVNAAADDPSIQNLQKAQEALAKLGPDARNMALQVAGMREEFRGLRDASAAGFAPGFLSGMRTLEDALPRMESGFRALADIAGDTFAESMADITSPRFAEGMSRFLANAPQHVDALADGLRDFASGTLGMMNALDPVASTWDDMWRGMGESFDRWGNSAQLEQSMQALADYAREMGPQVGDTLMSVADAFVAIGKAAAPLGGPVLQSLEALARVIETIADSPVGTPLLAAASALTIYSRAAKMAGPAMAMLGVQQKAVAGSAASAAAPVGLLANRMAVARGNVRGFAGQVRAIPRDLRTLSTHALTAGAATQRMSAQSAAARNNLIGVGKGVGIGVAALGGMALAANSSSQAMTILGTTASYAAMGFSAGGPWGAAAGTLLGISQTANLASQEMDGFVQQGSRAASQLDLSGIDTALGKAENRLAEFKDNAGDELSGWGGDLRWGGDLSSGDWWASQLGLDRADQLEKDVEKLRKARERLINTNGSFTGSELEAAKATKRFNELMGREAQMDQWRASIDAAEQSLQQNGRTLDRNTAAGRANAAMLRNMAVQAVNTSQGMRGVAKTEYLVKARDRLVKMRMAMGEGREEAERWANKRIKIDVDVASAARKTSALKADLRRLGVKPATIRAVMRDLASGKIRTVQQLANRLGLKPAQVRALLRDNATGGLKGLLRLMGVIRGKPTKAVVNAETKRAQKQITGVMTSLFAVDRKKTRPKIDADPSKLRGAARQALGALGTVEKKKVNPPIKADPRNAISGANAATAAMNNIPKSSNSTITVTRINKTINRVYNEAFGVIGGGHADGGYIAGPGGPRDDVIPAWLSNGEFVVNAAATARNRGLLESINAQRYADGGLVSRHPAVTAITDPSSLLTSVAAREDEKDRREKRRDDEKSKREKERDKKREDRRKKEAERREKKFNRLIDRADKHVSKAKELRDKEKQQLDAIRGKWDDLKSTVVGGLRSNIFDTSNDGWGSTSGLGWAGKLQADIKNSKDFLRLENSLKKKGLDGPGFMMLLNEGGIEALRAADKMSLKQLQQYENLAKQRQRLSNLAGERAGGIMYGAEYRAQNRELQQANRHLRQQTRELRDLRRQMRDFERRRSQHNEWRDERNNWEERRNFEAALRGKVNNAKKGARA